VPAKPASCAIFLCSGIVIQAVSRFLRFGSPTAETMIGIGFYLAPFSCLWMGYQVGAKSRSPYGKLLGVFCCFRIPWSFLESGPLSSGHGLGAAVEEVGGGIRDQLRKASQAGRHQGFGATSEVSSLQSGPAAAMACLLVFWMVRATATYLPSTSNAWDRFRLPGFPNPSNRQTESLF